MGSPLEVQKYISNDASLGRLEDDPVMREPTSPCWLPVAVSTLAALLLAMAAVACGSPGPVEPGPASLRVPTPTPDPPTVIPTTPTPTPAAIQDEATDRAVLVALYKATDGANWARNDKWLSQSPIGKWYGVITDASGRVTDLNLADNRLAGTIPSELGNLGNLQKLSLFKNQLAGEVPSELGGLTELVVLSLEFNQLTGTIPSELGNLANLTMAGLLGKPAGRGDTAGTRWTRQPGKSGPRP